MEFTPNLNLPKPADGENGWGDEMRDAMDTLDQPSAYGIGAAADAAWEGSLADATLRVDRQQSVYDAARYDSTVLVTDLIAPSSPLASVYRYVSAFDAYKTGNENIQQIQANYSHVKVSDDGNVGDLFGIEFTGELAGTADIGNLFGVWANTILTGAGTVTTYRGLVSDIYQTAGTVTTAYYAHFRGKAGGGTITNLYGLYIDAMTSGVTQSWNVYSAGATSKNKFEGRVFQGAPNSAPLDADLGNGQITVYLNQAGNALMFRVRYSDTTLKTGTVALT